MSVLIGLIILLVSCVGNAELWVILINRRHALRYHHNTLRRIRSLHDFAILLFPPFIFYAAGLRSGGLLVGGTLATLPIAVQGLLLITMFGFVSFSIAALRWNLRRDPPQVVELDGRICNVLRETPPAERHAVLGLQNTLAKMPLNQIWHLDVNRKHLRLPTVNGEGQVVRLAHFSDMHLLDCPGEGFHQRVADELAGLQPDFYAFTGDLLDDERLLDRAVRIFRQLADVAPGYFILGNHDWHLDHELIRGRISETGWIDVGERGVNVEHAGASILIAGTEAPWLGDNPKVSPPGDEALRLLLSHAPDQRDYAVENHFDVMLCGHNHGGQVVLPIVGPVYSPSCFGVRYAGGLFTHQQMVMHVSRGTGAKDTFRWNCPPEITLLELELAHQHA